jgi:enoyl-CoA hydratase/carnithine racemase
MNDPAKRNALSTAMMESLLQNLSYAKSDPSTKVVVVQASATSASSSSPSSSRVFCSGHDLTEMTRRPDEDVPAFQSRMQTLFATCTRLMMEIATFPLPTIAAVDGIATAAGCQLVATCDLAVATSASRFATPGVNIGLFCSTPAVSLMHRSSSSGSGLSRKHAMEMLLLGDYISARRAHEIGLINFVVKNNVDKEDDDSTKVKNDMNGKNDDPLHDAVQSLAYKIASKAPLCIQLGLQTQRKQQSTCLDLQDAYQLAQDTMVQNLLCDHAVQGIHDFLTKSSRRASKRKPQY